MTFALRLLWFWLTSRFGPRVPVTERSTVTLRAWPQETGLSAMHHHVFLQVMEIGRWALMLRAGQVATALRRGLVPMTAAQYVRYRRPVKRFASFQLHTQLAYWDEADLFIEQSLER